MEFTRVRLANDLPIVESGRLEFSLTVVEFADLEGALNVPVANFRDPVSSSSGRFRFRVCLTQVLKGVECTIEIGIITISLGCSREQKFANLELSFRRP